MTVTTRPARIGDAAQMCAVLNEIIAIGGTTAHQRPFDEPRMIAHYIAPKLLISCTLAEVAGGVVGFQSLEWADPDWEGEGKLPKGWAVIASFVSPSHHGQGIGRALFEATRKAAQDAGATTIDATIRADNRAGLSYYSGLGFKDYDIFRAVPLRDGTKVDRIRKSLVP